MVRMRTNTTVDSTDFDPSAINASQLRKRKQISNSDSRIKITLRSIKLAQISVKSAWVAGCQTGVPLPGSSQTTVLSGRRSVNKDVSREPGALHVHLSPLTLSIWAQLPNPPLHLITDRTIKDNCHGHESTTTTVVALM